MLLLYLVLTALGALFTTRLALWRSPHALPAAGATLLAAVAIPTGFSIGPYLAALALGLLALATVLHLRSHERAT